MTQLDLFSLGTPPATKDKKPLPERNAQAEAIREEENNFMNNGLEITEVNTTIETSFIQSTPAEIATTPAAKETIEPAANLGSRTGDIVFEDSKISVKIKSRPGAKKEAPVSEPAALPGKPVKRYGLPSLPELSQKVEPRKSIVTKQPKSAFSESLREKLDSVKNGIKDGLLKEAMSEKKKQEKAARPPQKRGRKSFKEIDTTVDLLDIPEDEELFKKQYYPISEVAGWFNVNTSLLRFWENEFDILKPRKNRKGDRMFRPEDVKNLQLIYELLRQRKYSIEGAKEYLKTNRNKADVQVQLTTTLQKFRSFLLELKANL